MPSPVRLLSCVSSLMLTGWLASPLSSQPSGAGYQVGPKDLLHIEVLEAPELNGERRVADDGTILLPLLGSVDVSDRTPFQIQEELKKLLEERFFQRGRATVSVEVKEYRHRPITVIGAVRNPGPLAFSGRWTLLEALTAAGGVTGNQGNYVHVMRRADNGLSDQIEISLDDLLVKADPKVNIPIFDNDLVNVPSAVQVTIYLLGEVKSPGAQTFTSRERISLLTAIARAGGLTDRAAKKITVKREHRYGDADELVFDYKDILSGRAPDPLLESGDVIHVKQSFL